MLLFYGREAIRQFGELCTTLCVETIRTDMVPIFVKMYNLPYPSVEKCSPLHYVPQWLTLVDNLMFVFEYLSSAQQISFIGQLLPFMDQIFNERIKNLNQFIGLMKMNIGSYDALDIKNIVAPMCRVILIQLATLVTVQYTDWSEANKLAANILKLQEECIECLKPYNWMNMDIMDSQMAPIKELLDEIVNILDPRSYRLVCVIYYRLRQRNILLTHQLKPFLDSEVAQHYMTLITQSEHYIPRNDD